MIVPISYFDPNNGQNTDIVSRVQALYAIGETSITIKELEKTYTNSAESQLQMIQDVTRYINLFGTTKEAQIQPTPTPASTPAPVSAPKKVEVPNKSPYSLALAAILCFFVGHLGIHRFYVGKIGTGLAQLFTLGGLGIWSFIDFIVILFGAFQDQEGRKITH